MYRIRPTTAQHAQHAQLAKILSDQRNLYNAALEERLGAWRRGVSISMSDQTKSLTEIRASDPHHGGIPYNLSKWTLKRLDEAFKAFFRRAKMRSGKAGFARFRGAGGSSSFGFHRAPGLRLVGRKLHFSGVLIGGLDLKMHRRFVRVL